MTGGAVATLPRMTQTPNTLTIRLARPDDAAALEDILTATYEGTWRPQMTPEKYQYFLDSGKIPRYVAERGARFYVCEAEGRVAGMVILTDGQGDTMAIQEAALVRDPHFAVVDGRCFDGDAHFSRFGCWRLNYSQA